MYKNKVLSAAIVAALSTGVTVVQAGEFDLLANDVTTVLTDTTRPVYSYEQFAASGTDMLTYQYYARYKLANSIPADIYVTFTLSAGTWGDRLTSTDLSILDNTGTAKTSAPAVSIVDQGQTDQSSVQFLVAAGKASLSAADQLRLKFKVGGVPGVLSIAGTPIKLDVLFSTATQGGGVPDEPKSVTVASSGQGTAIKLEKDQTAGEVAIDVARGSTVFVGGIDDSTVSLGTIEISDSSTKVKKKDGVTDFEFKNQASEGNLTITNGIFAASTTDDVYLDLVSPNTEYNAPSSSADGDIKADSVTAEEATWKLSSAELDQIYAYTGKVPIIVKANGTTVINEPSDPPSATFTIKFQTEASFSGKLRQIKRNGIVCKLYQAPNAEASDVMNLRITNKTALPGLVLATLHAVDGTPLFTNQTLIEALEPQKTVRLTAANLAEKLPEGTTTWIGRGTLTLSSDLTDMAVSLSLRNKLGGPLINHSVGASGNGCD
jgi:hypothetical protein